MNLQLTDRAKQKGVVEVKFLHKKEHDGYSTAIVHEKRSPVSGPKGKTDDFLHPVIFFDSNVKHGDYDRAKRYLERAGFIALLPSPDEFRTEFYDINIGNHNHLVRSWGYESRLLPPSKRWDENQILEHARIWVDDNEIIAEMIMFVIKNMYLQQYEDGTFESRPENEIFEMIKEEFSYTGLF